jgi:hypothetical protein
MDKIERYKYNIEMCIEIFNSTVLGIKEQIKSELEDDVELNIYYIAIEATIKKNIITPLILFINHIYTNDVIRRKLIEKDEVFFSNSSHSEIGLSEKNKEHVEMFFLFQRYWKILPTSKKEYIKDAMETLVKTARTYLKIKGKYDDLMEKTK